MKVLIYGASGMVGSGVLRECLADPSIADVVTIGRSPAGGSHPKLREWVRSDLLDYADLESRLWAFDACFFCLGVSSAGLGEDAYRRATFDITLAAARALVCANAAMTFIYVSGAGTDSRGAGRSMWARIKGETENALLALPFKAAFMLRPGLIQPLHGIRSKTRSYRLLYAALKPLLPILKQLFPAYVLSTEQIGRVMLSLAKDGYPKAVLETPDILTVSRRLSQRYGVTGAGFIAPS
jgi:uncharacterized protein YbjT (DUF2867 family)